SGFALGYAAVYLGIGEAAFDYMLEYAKTKTLKPSTEPMSHHPLVQRTVAQVGTALRAARLLMHEAARVRMDGTDKAATMLAVNQAKAYAAEVGLDATTRALQLVVELGAVAGDELDALAAEADRHPPTLRAYDERGRRVDEVVFHPAYRAMERLAFERFGLAAMSHREGVLGWPGRVPHVV